MRKKGVAKQSQDGFFFIFFPKTYCERGVRRDQAAEE